MVSYGDIANGRTANGSSIAKKIKRMTVAILVSKEEARRSKLEKTKIKHPVSRIEHRYELRQR
jgi:hypothetical protein